METFIEALKKLKEGDVCFAHSDHNPAHFDAAVRHDLADHGQHPYAAVITCGDSRVPPEHIFSVGLGSLFVIRNAGNVIGPFELGSAEYAAEHLNVPLILVLGHTHCGAVESTLAGGAEGHIKEITDEVRRAIGDETDPRKCEWLNARHSVKVLRGSEILSRMEAEGKVRILAAIYDIETGEVTFDEET